MRIIVGIAILIVCSCAARALAQDARITVHAATILHTLSPYMTGACIEDVNHEIYGGIYSQMIFGESFQEPPTPTPLKGFTPHGGNWTVQDAQLHAPAGDGYKLISDQPPFSTGQVAVEILFTDKAPGNAGLIAKVAQPGLGPDKFIGYEIALDPSRQILVLGRHRNNWEPIKEFPCHIPVNQWIPLVVTMTAKTLEISVNAQPIAAYQDTDHPLASGAVGLRTWQREAQYRNLTLKTNGQTTSLPFVPADPHPDQISGMWRAIRRGSATGSFSLERDNPFLTRHSQRITFTAGQGEIGIENQSLNRWGMYFVQGKPYEGCLWVRADKDTDFHVALESRDGSKTYAEQNLQLKAPAWQRLDFALTPSATDTAARFAIKLKQPASIVLAYVSLHPGPWGRFNNLPVRKDVADALRAQGLTVLRYGGSMVNAPEYRWKKMIGPRDRRPPYKGTWYPCSTNGWGIIDFIDLCEALGLLAIPALNIDETPQDIADFVEYVNGSRDTPWGRKRADAAHTQPYNLKVLQLGNEEAVDDAYWQRFEPMAKAIWAKDANIIIVVGDFAYGQPIKDPYNFTGAPRIKTLAAHKKILDLAAQNNREIWFDVHIWNNEPRDPEGLGGLPSFIDALRRLNPAAKSKVAVFELNAGNHAVRRAIANAHAINELQRIGDRVPIVCSANCLQPYKQNDNDWNQGLLFLTPSQVWGQPPYYVTQMIRRLSLPRCVQAESQSPSDALDVTATLSNDGNTLALQVVNLDSKPVSTRISLDGFVPTNPNAQVTELSGQLDDVNTPQEPQRITPRTREWPHHFNAGVCDYTFPPYSFTILLMK